MVQFPHHWNFDRSIGKTHRHPPPPHHHHHAKQSRKCFSVVRAPFQGNAGKELFISYLNGINFAFLFLNKIYFLLARLSRELPSQQAFYQTLMILPFHSKRATFFLSISPTSLEGHFQTAWSAALLDIGMLLTLLNKTQSSWLWPTAAVSTSIQINLLESALCAPLANTKPIKLIQS